jgi:hypothetical protein
MILPNITNEDLINMQWMAARYAQDRKTFSTDTVNQITARMIENGVYPRPDKTRSDDGTPTVWARDGSFGWPTQLIERYGWDGCKKGTER